MSLKNHAGACGFEPPPFLAETKRNGGIGGQRANEYLSYLDVKKRPYVHLLDGGLSDNIALRSLMEASGTTGGLDQLMKFAHVKNVRKFVILTVNAETSPDVMEFRSDQVPTMSKAMSALVDAPINRYSFDTIHLMKLGVAKWRQELRTKPRDPDSPFTKDADIYFINASLAEIADRDERASLMKIPTTLYLTDEQIERLLQTAARLIRNDPEFQRLMKDIGTGK